MIFYLVLSFLIIVNMYIAVILENYSQVGFVREAPLQATKNTTILFQATDDVQEGITDEDYDLFYETWQEFDPQGSQYIDYENLSEFLDVLEAPLQIPRPNKFKIINVDVPIVQFTNPDTGKVTENCVFCSDILDILTQDFFSRKRKNKALDMEDVKVGGAVTQSRQMCVFVFILFR